MRGDAHWQCPCTFRASCSSSFHGTFECGLMAGDDNLPGAVIIRYLNDLIRCAGLCAKFIEHGDVAAQDGSHAARVEFSSALHQLAAPADEPDPVRKG